MTDFILRDGVRAQFEAMCRGIDAVFPLVHLALFSAVELEHVLRGQEYHPWTIEGKRRVGALLPMSRLHWLITPELAGACVAEHGFTLTSPTVVALFEVMASFTAEEQRKFVLFVSGSPNLPVGGSISRSYLVHSLIDPSVWFRSGRTSSEADHRLQVCGSAS